MATYTALEAMNLIDTSFGSDMLDSEEESDIDEDPSLPSRSAAGPEVHYTRTNLFAESSTCTPLH